jgi:hypothetical protein
VRVQTQTDFVSSLASLYARNGEFHGFSQDAATYLPGLTAWSIRLIFEIRAIVPIDFPIGIETSG